MNRYIWIFICLGLILGKMECLGKEQEEVVGTLYADAAVLMDGDSGRILYEKNGKKFMANASTTKILTCILALENANPEDIVMVSSYAASMPDVQLHIREGEQYRLKDLLYSLMLESHNDVAVAVAEHVAGSCEKFASLMNQKAKEIGCKNTLFITPNGLDATVTDKSSGISNFHGTTAEDLANIMRYCIRISPMKDAFIEITSTSSYIFSDLGNSRHFLCNNHNTLYNLMEGVISGKTGFTGKAGYCYVGAVKQDGKTYVVALLACGWPGNKNYKWKDCSALIDYGIKKYELVNMNEIRKKYQPEMKVQVKNAKRNKIKEQVWIELINEKNNFDTVLLGIEDVINLKFNIKEVEAPVMEGQEMGECLFFVNNELWRKEKLYSGRNVEKIDFISCIRMVMDKVV